MIEQPPPPPQISPDGKFYWDGQKWQPMPAAAAPTAAAGPAAPNPALLALKAEKTFGFLGGCKVKIDRGYIEVKGAPMGARARVPVDAVDLATVQRSIVGTVVSGQPQLVLIGRGAELGHADLPLGKRKAGEEAAEWINEIVRKYRTP